jgi:uncharacterized protein (TIGR02647 family)
MRTARLTYRHARAWTTITNDFQDADNGETRLSFSASTTEQLNLLLQFDSTSLDHGIKVHSNAREEVISACQHLFDRGLISRRDGGYLTDAGIEALEHAQSLAGLLGVLQAAPQNP